MCGGEGTHSAYGGCSGPFLTDSGRSGVMKSPSPIVESDGGPGIPVVRISPVPSPMDAEEGTGGVSQSPLPTGKIEVKGGGRTPETVLASGALLLVEEAQGEEPHLSRLLAERRAHVRLFGLSRIGIRNGGFLLRFLAARKWCGRRRSFAPPPLPGAMGKGDESTNLLSETVRAKRKLPYSLPGGAIARHRVRHPSPTKKRKKKGKSSSVKPPPRDLELSERIVEGGCWGELPRTLLDRSHPYILPHTSGATGAGSSLAAAHREGKEATI